MHYRQYDNYDVERRKKMKGLLVKDVKLMKSQMIFFIMIIFMSICLSLSMENILFNIGYLSIITPLFVLSTISFDEFENGSAFLFTLPISRKEYIIEKYCFGMMLGIAALVLAIIFSLCMGMVKGLHVFSDVMFTVPFAISAIAVLLAVFIPTTIKFGGEKSKFVIIIFAGIAGVIGFCIAKILKYFDADVKRIVDSISNLNIGILISGAIVLALCIVLLSIRISISILQKKEF